MTNVMNITRHTQRIILKALRKAKQKNIWLANKVGKDRSWPTKLFNNQIKTLDIETVRKIEEALDIKLLTLERVEISPEILEIAQAINKNKAFADVAQALLLAMEDKIYTTKYIATEDMSKIGSKIRAIVMNAGVDDLGNHKDGKIARQVLELLA